MVLFTHSRILRAVYGCLKESEYRGFLKYVKCRRRSCFIASYDIYWNQVCDVVRNAQWLIPTGLLIWRMISKGGCKDNEIGLGQGEKGKGYCGPVR